MVQGKIILYKTTQIIAGFYSRFSHRHSLKHKTISMTMHIVQSFLHMLQVGVAYILMLIAMLFNVWLFLAVVVGSGIGYFIFAKVKHLSSPFRESNDHCH